MNYADAYSSDRSLKGKVRRRAVRLLHRRPLTTAPPRPMLSFTFDDAPLSAVQAGAQVLEARGVRGTYYVAAGLAGQEAPMGICAVADAPACEAIRTCFTCVRAMMASSVAAQLSSTTIAAAPLSRD